MKLLAVTMLQAILAGARYPPPGIADTAEHRALWDRIAASVEDMPPGVMPDIPADWAD